MFLTTKTPLAEWLEQEAAYAESFAAGDGFPRYTKPEELRINAHRMRVAAYALRRLTPLQEAAMLEFQVGGPDGSGADSYDNPITIEKRTPEPPLVDMSYRSPSWYGMRDRLVESLRGNGR